MPRINRILVANRGEIVNANWASERQKSWRAPKVARPRSRCRSSPPRGWRRAAPIAERFGLFAGANFFAGTIFAAGTNFSAGTIAASLHRYDEE